MKRVIYFLAFIACTAVMFTGCEEDLCENSMCQNGGTCDEETGNCICPAGFEGNDCEVASVDKFVGTWSATDVCPSDTYVYDAIVSADSTGASDFVINNFGAFGTNLGFSANLDSTGTMIVVPFTDPGNYVTTEGAGTISADNTTISWTYTVTDSTSATETCTGTWTLQ